MWGFQNGEKRLVCQFFPDKYHQNFTERWDRDNFIDIIWQNIDRENSSPLRIAATALPSALTNWKRGLSKSTVLGQPYDYKSILHYDSLAFSKNGFPTMLPKQKCNATIGNAKDFSDVDLAKINRMYSCPSETKQQTAPFARAQHSPIYQAINKYDDRPKLPPQYYDGMHSNKPQRCEDKITVCWWTADRCRAPAIYAMMTSLCPKTCGFC
ncbi:shTK domain protein [Cooperia oncophora]